MFADVDWGSRKINPYKICAECWPGAAFGPYWLLTERLRYETTPLLPALRDRVHVHGQRDYAHSSRSGSNSASETAAYQAQAADTTGDANKADSGFSSCNRDNEKGKGLPP